MLRLPFAARRTGKTTSNACSAPVFGGLALMLTVATSTVAQETFSDVNPNQSTRDAVDPDAASGGRVNGLANVAGNNAVYYAATEWGGLYRSNDTGLTWTRLDGHLPAVTWDVEVDPSNTNRVYATSFYDGRVNSLAGINVSTDGGNTWTRPATATPPAGLCTNARRIEPSAFGISIDPANTQNAYIGTNCGLAISNNSGVTWTFIDPTPASLATNVWDVVVHDGGIIDICGDDAHLRSTDGGTTWTQGTGLPSGRCSIAVSPDEPNVLFVTVANNIYESDDAGANWTNLGTPDSRRQGRIPFVAINDRTGNSFDLWFGDVRLYRGGCTSNPAGGGLRCPMARTGAATSPPPAGWSGPFTRSVGGHDDVGDIVFDSQAGNNACPMIFSSDGGVYFNTNTTSPGCHSPAWEQPNVTPHALWLWALDGADQGGLNSEDLYFGIQDNGSFATTNAGVALPTWTNVNCCDVFDITADPVRVVYDVCCGFSLRVGGSGMTAVTVVNPNPPGNITMFRFPDFIDRFGPNQYIAVTSSGGYLTNSITPNPVAWTQIGAASTPTGGFCAVQSSVSGGTPTFYAQAGGCQARTADRVWTYTGTAPGGTWQQVTPPLGGLGFGVFAVDPNDPNRLLASNLTATGPRMILSTDGGATWQNLPELDNLMTGGGAFLYQSQRGPINWTTFAASPQPTLVAFDPEDSNIIIAGARSSGVFLSTDGGEDWRLITDPFDPLTSGKPHLTRPRFAYFDHEPSNQVNIYLGTQGRGVWRINFFRPPLADADGPYTTDVGVDITLDGTGSTDPDGGTLTFEWDFDADGVFNDGTGPTPIFGTSFVAVAGSFPVALRVTDPDGAIDVDETTVTVRPVAAGLRRALSFHVGAAVPLGTLNSFTDIGPTANLDFIIPINPQLAADLRLGYSLFRGAGGASDLDMWNLSANLKVLPVLTTPYPFLNGGLGLYYVDSSDLEAGFNIGAGVGQPLTSNLDVELTANYHSTFTASPDLEFTKLQLGLVWAF